MIGLFVLGILGLWLWFAIWAGDALSKRIFKRDSHQPPQDDTQNHRIIRFIAQTLITLLVVLLPFIDQLIAYPKWQQMCATTGDFEWGPNMDEKKVQGREVITKFEHRQSTIFPSVKVEDSSMSIYDAKTKELIFKKPHYAFSASALIYLPSSSGDKTAPFLPSCENFKFMHKNDSLHKQLQLTEIENKGK